MQVRKPKEKRTYLTAKLAGSSKSKGLTVYGATPDEVFALIRQASKNIGAAQAGQRPAQNAA
jgi:hypothetical protein